MISSPPVRASDGVMFWKGLPPDCHRCVPSTTIRPTFLQKQNNTKTRREIGAPSNRATLLHVVILFTDTVASRENPTVRCLLNRHCNALQHSDYTPSTIMQYNLTDRSRRQRTQRILTSVQRHSVFTLFTRDNNSLHSRNVGRCFCCSHVEAIPPSLQRAVQSHRTRQRPRRIPTSGQRHSVSTRHF